MTWKIRGVWALVLRLDMSEVVPQRIPPKQRSHMMASVKKRHTKPELVIRSYLHRNGLRFVLHDKRLPGTPDIVLPSRRTVVFVHGCFWHRCPYCAAGRQEIRSNRGYWLPKLKRNQSRDVRAQQELAAAGWHSLVVWECQISDEHVLLKLVESVRHSPKTVRS